MKLNINHVHRGFLFLLFVLFASSAALAQTTVTGTITDAENGDPLIGASILVTGTSTGTVTDFDGNFTLNVPAGAESLTVSYTGYATQTIPLTGQTELDITMTSGELLDEVVVVGYGTVTQKQVTSAVTSIDSEDFNAGNINDPTQLIQGKVAGLTISKVGGNANGGSVIRLRGLSSFGGNQSPLIIIDGVVGANLNTVDPADIESINVLKDGSAAAIYGIQASAGVILITTKRGAAGDAQFSYRGYVTAEEIAKRPEVADRNLYLELVEETGRLIGADDPIAFRNNVDYGGNTDWIDRVTRTGISHVHNLSYSGGAGGMTYRASVNYRDIQGIGVDNDGFRQINGRLNINQSAFNDKLNLSVDVTATDRDADIFNNNVFKYAITYNPTAPARVDEAGYTVPDAVAANSLDTYGGYFEIDNFDYFNPVAIAQTTASERQQTNILYNLRASYDILEDVSLSASYSRNREDGINGSFGSRFSRFGGGAAGSPARRGFASRSVNDNRNDLFEVTATYNTDLGNNGLELLAGYSWQEYQFQGFNAGGAGLPSDAFGFNNLNVLNDIAAGQIAVGSYQASYRVIGFFGRARLSLGSAYNITASVRRDGTSRNGPENKWDFFPAVSASADLVDALSLEGPDQLKFRVGYGITGSLPNGNYAYLQTFGTGPQFPQNGGYIPTISPSSNANPNLRFEKKQEFNAGLDFAFDDYRLTGSLDFYVRNTGDLITSVIVPSPPFLFSSVEANLNNVDLINTGLELALGYSFGDLGGDGFSYEPRLTFSTFSTTLEDNGENPDFNFGAGGVQEFESSSPGSPGQNLDPVSRVIIGEDFGGIYTRRLDVDATLASGQYVFLGDGEADKVLVGNGLPDFSASLSNTFRYGPLDLNIFLRGDFGHDLVNMPRNFYGQQGNLATRAIENVIVNDLFLRGVTSAPKVSDYFVEDASFLALDNAQLGYTFDLGPGTGFNDLRVYVAGQNLFYITDYSGVDPNVRFFDDQNSNGIIDGGENALTPGIDRRSTFFRTRSFTFGVNVGF
ncbi:iron complex outermembrane receptor protein [Lewinella marina]|uniref:SusC/RagA family TonB-linked outer membrane protein n=1 Tax=Neolewinella marina TaxID=438751 RepID=A0A2G0CHS0_9BACT|nr:SusC/RagA family TonB-linked outer membrane protein [Neolewinella marina]NJB85362.1 iron complex outermembrane receptor protein [Neolewinella marina]PHK99522.1 SusC/RagA family TonB-linked outer membrane protein [Neolewinella marina]